MSDAEIRHSDSTTEDLIEASASDQNNEDILKVAKGGGISFVGTVAVRALNYAYSIALIWGLGAENFSLFILALAVTNFIGAMASLGLNQGVVRFGAIYAKTHGRVGLHKATMAALSISVPISLLFLGVLFLGADPIAEGVFNKPQLVPIIKMLGLSIPFVNIHFLLLAATRAFKIMKYSVIVWIVQPLVALVLSVIFLAFGLGMQAVVLSFVVSHILGAGLSFYFYLQIMPTKQKGVERFPVGEMLKFSLPLSLTNLLHFTNERTEVFFLGMLPGAVNVGIYNIAWRLASLEIVFTLALDHIIAPFSSELSHRKVIKQLETLYKTTTKWSFTGALILFGIFVLFAPTIMDVFDPAFVAGSGVLIALGLAQLFRASTGSCGTLLIMSGRSGLSLLNTIILFAVSIALDWLLIPDYGLAGAALAGSLAVILVNLLRVVEVWLTLKIHPFKLSFIKPIVAGALSYMLVFAIRTFIYSGPLLVDLVYALIYVAAFVIIVYLLNLDQEDTAVLTAIHRKILGSKTSAKTV